MKPFEFTRRGPPPADGSGARGAVGQTIKSIQISRGIAALAVVVFHVDLILTQKLGRGAFHVVTDFGYLGVPYFFVLSGFIIATAHQQDISRPDKLPRYLFKRFARVYPVYWIFSIVYIGAALAGLGQPDFRWGWRPMIEALTLVHFTPDFGTAPLEVAWTLFFEIRFYALFALAIINIRLALAVGAVWLVAIATLTDHNLLQQEFLSYWNVSFAFGVLARILYQKIPARYWWVAIGCGVAAVATVFATQHDVKLEWRNPIILPITAGFASIVLGVAMLEQGVQLGKARLPMLLGNASYSMYLVHSGVISAAVIIVSKISVLRAMPIQILFFVILLGAVLAGIVAHLWIEKPILKVITYRKPVVA